METNKNENTNNNVETINDPALAQKVALIKEFVEAQLTDPSKITMPNSTTLAYQFNLTPAQAVSLALPETVKRTEIQFDLMMEFMEVIGLNEEGIRIATGEYPYEAKKYFIPRMFEVYGKKDTAPGEQKADAPLSAVNEEESLTSYIKKEFKKEIRRFDLDFDAKDTKGNPLHLFIEIEVDSDDSSYLNYWIGCEEHTAKHYIASCQGSIDQANPLEVVKVKNLYFFLNEIR